MWKAVIEQITALRPVLETLASYSNVSWRCDFWLYVFIGKSPSIDMVVPGEKKKALASIFYFAWGGYNL